MENSIRKLKIYRKLTNTYSSHFYYGGVTKCIPQLRMEGVWLERAGFIVGARITITVSQNKLIIELDTGKE